MSNPCGDSDAAEGGAIDGGVVQPSVLHENTRRQDFENLCGLPVRRGDDVAVVSSRMKARVRDNFTLV